MNKFPNFSAVEEDIDYLQGQREVQVSSGPVD